MELCFCLVLFENTVIIKSLQRILWLNGKGISIDSEVFTVDLPDAHRVQPCGFHSFSLQQTDESLLEMIYYGTNNHGLFSRRRV